VNPTNYDVAVSIASGGGAHSPSGQDVLPVSEMEGGEATETSSGTNNFDSKALAAGLATAFAGATTSYLLLWFVLPILLPISAAAMPTLALLFAALIGSAFAGIEVMETVNTSRALTLSALKDSVIGGFRVMLCLDR
jgi:hypothetical protein